MAAPSTIILLLFTSLMVVVVMLPSPSLAVHVSPKAACNSTIDPSFCTKVLPDNNTADIYDYGRYAVLQSLRVSRKFAYLLKKFTKLPALSNSTSRAISDCVQLSELNIDFLTDSLRTVNTTSSVLSTPTADDIQSLLSAVLTNQQTCLDGIQTSISSPIVGTVLKVPLLNDTKLYSMSLALFNKGWVPKVRSKRWTKAHRNFKFGRLPLKMADQDRQMYESLRGRNMLETGNGRSVLVSQMVVVSQSKLDNRKFSTITDAINAAPNNTDAKNGYFLIYVRRGVYEEYVDIPKNKRNLMIMGDGIGKTIITGKRSVVDGWTTYNSATFAVVAPNFVGVNITIRNTAGAAKHQAVALRNGADLSVFYQCSFEGYQDTLYTHSLRQFYRECDIYGTVDFIFGNAAVVLQKCNMYPRLPMLGQFNAITAQGRTDPNQNTGTVIHNCKLRPAKDLELSKVKTETYLGRPWKEYSRTVYMKTSMAKFINPTGWMAWNGNFALNTLYYGEYDNTGKGGRTSGRVRWKGFRVMTTSDATNFTAQNFLMVDHWLPQTMVPYTQGLV